MNFILRLFLFFIILFLGFTGIAFYWTFYKPLPNHEINLELEPIVSPVSIHWDNFGIPHLFADNDSDLYFAMGYIHAQDRLWQMTVSQLAAEGRFAEFFGSELIQFDKYQRTLGFWKTAEHILNTQITPDELSILQSYSEGVNTYAKNNATQLPVQFALTGMSPLEWTPQHSLAIIRMMGWELNMSWWNEATYSYLKEILPKNRLNEILLLWDSKLPTFLNNDETESLTNLALLPLLELEVQKRKLLKQEVSLVKSNAWVVNGSKSSTGYPILAGDIHFGLNVPGKWYELHLNKNKQNVSGATIPGVPGIVAGQNDFMAWTFTNIMADDTDFFLEKTDPLDPNK